METATKYQGGAFSRTMISDDADPSNIRVNTSIDIDPILAGIHRDKELIDPKSTNKLVARVPVVIAEKAMLEGWDEDDWKRWLNDPDNKMFRIWEGRV